MRWLFPLTEESCGTHVLQSRHHVDSSTIPCTPQIPTKAKEHFMKYKNPTYNFRKTQSLPIRWTHAFNGFPVSSHSGGKLQIVKGGHVRTAKTASLLRHVLLQLAPLSPKPPTRHVTTCFAFNVTNSHALTTLH